MNLASDLKVAILATHGIEHHELAEPRQTLEEAGVTVHIVAPQGDEIKAWDIDNWSIRIKVDKLIQDANPDEYDGLLLPGGLFNTDQLRMNLAAIGYVKHFIASGKIVAAISYGAQILIEAGAVEGKQITSQPSIKFDFINAGALWLDEEIVADNGLITAQSASSLLNFNKKFLEELKEGLHQRTETII